MEAGSSWPEVERAFGLEAFDTIRRTLDGDAGLDNAGSFRAWHSVTTMVDPPVALGSSWPLLPKAFRLGK